METILNKKANVMNIDFGITSAILNVLYERNSDNVAIDFALKYLAQSFGACRCFIVESLDKGDTYNFTHEWCEEGVFSHIEAQTPVSNELAKELFISCDENGVYVCEDVGKFNIKGALPGVLMQSGTKAFMHAQIERDGVVSFYLGVEDCKNSRKWNKGQISTLHHMARIFSIVLNGKYLNEQFNLLNKRSQISAYVGDNTNNFIYIVDPETFEMVHMNKRALGMYNNPEESVWKNKKCYELLYDKKEPCEFCTNKYVTADEFYEWSHYNEKFDKTYLFRDKLIKHDGRILKFQVATDITKLSKLEEELKNKLEEQDLLLNSIQMLHTSETPDANIEKIISIVCEFFGAQRGLILQIDDGALTASNTHEWVASSEMARKHMLQKMPIEIMQTFFDKFSKTKASYAENLSKLFEPSDSFFKLLDKEGIKSFICAPILNASGEFIGMFGVDNPTKNTEKHWILGSLSVFVSDFLEKNKQVNSLNSLSYYDTLTGAKNRHSYMRELKSIDEESLRSLGVAYVDIKGLSRINEQKGARYGDGVLCKLTKILTDIFDENVYRVGGDEFVVLAKNINELEFEAKINGMNIILTNELDTKVSVGFTWNADVNDDEAQNMDKYNTVWNNKNYTAILSKNLEKEIKRGKYPVYLQPQINLKTKELGGAEALIRRLDASGNVQSPASFVPFYEKEGMISTIDLHVFETVCKLIASWKERGISTDIKFSVNFSRATVMEKGIVNKLCDICSKYSLERSLFIVEITETINHTDDNVFSDVIASFKNVGFCVSLDDFGSGFSNLSALKISDFDEIKIDMGIVKDLHVDKKSKILTKVALDLCDEFDGMVSVAEGIENEEQCNILTDLNCEKGQGYFFSKPVGIDWFEKKYMI